MCLENSSSAPLPLFRLKLLHFNRTTSRALLHTRYSRTAFDTFDGIFLNIPPPSFWQLGFASVDVVRRR